MTPRARLAAAVLAAASLAVPALADTISVRSGKIAEIKYTNATVTGIKGGEIYFTVEGGTETHKRLADITNLDVTNETSFNLAEKAYRDAQAAKDPAAAKAKYAEAASGYQAAAKSAKPWLRDFAATRMGIVAPLSGRPDLAIGAWATLVPTDPVTAAKSLPNLNSVDPKSQYLGEAMTRLTVSKNGTSKPDEKRAYLEMIAAIQRHVGDAEGEIRTQQERVAIGGSPQELAELAVVVARFEFGRKNLDAAAAQLAKVDPALLSETARADLLYMNAEFRAGKLAPAAAGDAWKDLALDYMRIVALHPASQHAGPALLKVAEIFETNLKEPETALKVYRQVAREHATTPAAVAAQKAIDRLAKSAAAGN